MAISMADHFKLQKRAQNFERDSFLTLKDMRDFNTNYLPDIFTATCLETGKFYIFNIGNTVDPVTGQWRELGGVDGLIKTTTTTDADGNTITTTTIGGITTTVTTNPGGDIIQTTGTIGGVTSVTDIDPTTGDSHSSVGDKVVSGTAKKQTTSTDIDKDGNPVSIQETIETTPTGTKKTVVKETTKPDGSKVTVKEVINGGSDGVDVGAATGVRETTESDPTGNPVGTPKTEDTSYVNGEEELWATEDDIDTLYGSLLGGFGWII